MNHRLWLIGAALLAALALTMVAIWFIAPAVRSSAGDYDLIGMLRDMEQANTATQAVNDRILDSLSSVESQAARVTAVDTKLTTLESGLAAQQKVLDRLKAITAEEAGLSRALQELAAVAVTGTQSMADTAGTEARDLSTMNRVTATLAERLQNIGWTNNQVADKLDTVDSLSARILNDMP